MNEGWFAKDTTNLCRILHYTIAKSQDYKNCKLTAVIVHTRRFKYPFSLKILLNTDGIKQNNNYVVKLIFTFNHFITHEIRRLLTVLL